MLVEQRSARRAREGEGTAQPHAASGGWPEEGGSERCACAAVLCLGRNNGEQAGRADGAIAAAVRCAVLQWHRHLREGGRGLICGGTKAAPP